MTEPPPPQWFVLVDESAGSYLGRDLTQTVPGGDLESTRQFAEHLAFTYQPRHPSSPRSRTVYRSGDNTWVVNVVGMTRAFYFTVTVAQWIGSAPA